MKNSTTTLFAILLLSLNSLAQTTKVVRPGQNNVPITEVQFNHNGNTITQTTEASGTLVNTDKAVELTYVKVNDGTTKVLSNFNSLGAVIRNNNFTSSTSGVGVYKTGSSIGSPNSSTWEDAMVNSGSDNNVLNYLYYDHSKNVPSGADFDIVWTKGWENSDYLLVGERNGNTCFALTPLDSNGNVISSAYKLQFGNCYGSVRAEYDWNIGFAPTNITNQPMVFTVIKMSTFNTDKNIFGFRIDNTGDADPKFFGLSDVTFEDNPNNPLIGGISGFVFNDANGLKNNIVDGSAINKPEGNQLYASLINSSDLVVETTEVDENGYYEFLNLEADTYEVVLSTNNGTIGQSAPAASLPTYWNYMGEHVGSGSGSDGNTNGVLTSISVNTAFVENVNFGIEKSPESENKSKTIGVPTFGQEDALTASNSYPQVEGSDYEDGSLGENNIFVVTDTTSMNGNELYYNGVRVALNSAINNFDFSNLTVKYVGDQSTSFAFNYFFKDAAEMDDETPAEYSINWMSALPVKWLDYNAVYVSDMNAVVVQWSTSQEINNSHFEVLRSSNGSTFELLGTQLGQGNFQGVTAYEFIDATAELGMTYYYKIQQVDFDGKNSATDVMLVDLNQGNNNVRVYPNPFNSSLDVTSVDKKFNTITITDMAGKVFVNESTVNMDAFTTLSTQDWPTGMYLCTFKGANDVHTIKLIKK